MSSPLLDVGEEEEEEEEEEGQSNVTLLTSSGCLDSVYPNISELKERNYMGISDCLSEEISAVSPVPDESKSSLNLRATELRLGLPGSQSPERDSKPCLLSLNQLDKTFFPLHPSNDSQYSSSQKTVGSGSKRGFSDAMDGFFEAKYVANSEVTAMLSPGPSSNLGLKTGSLLQNPATQPVNAKETVQERPHTANERRGNHNDSANDTSSAPATKTQVVGWPPIRAFRKNSLASTSKNTAEVDAEAGSAPLFVKVRMDGAPYLRKVDLRNYSAYQELSSALEGMFSCFTIGQYGSHGALGREMLSENKLKDLLHGSEYVLTYEDKEGDLMLLGDVPWEMFIGTCKRLRLMKVSDAIGLAPRVMEKSSNQN